MLLPLGSLTIELLPDLAVWVPSHNAVLISDVHLGKGAHFRANGIPVPDGAFQEDLQRIAALTSRYDADLYVVGDLVHAGHNEEWQRFGDMQKATGLSVTLIAGNHDRWAERHAEELGVRVVPHLMMGNVLLQHNPDDPLPDDVEGPIAGRICGHKHPSITINGPAGQSVRSRCFHLQGSTLILPGFGRFTGTHRVEPGPDDRIFVPVGSEVLEYAIAP